ncbi:MAG TPA: hypothetical protein IAC64_10150 [Candidatus Caccomorpha excrementavium]|nr:hypothetical protein [Candidatus Caccomorpha excrementavium]
MLREFIKCSGLEDRIRLIDESVPSDWDESELATVCQIAGIADKVKGMDAEETLEVLRSALSDKLDESMEEDEAALPFGRILEEEKTAEDESKEGSAMEEVIRTSLTAHIGKSDLM